MMDVGYTSNQYQELQIEEHTGMEETTHSHTELETNNQQTKEPKPPPIYIHGVTNYRAMTQIDYGEASASPLRKKEVPK
jgi:hypothetical protein